MAIVTRITAVHKNAHNMDGAFTGKHYKAGDVVEDIRGQVMNHATMYTFQVAPGIHVLPDSAARFVNYLCQPNCAVQGLDIVALRDLELGEEITVDYNLTEDCLAIPFQCDCCGRWIRGKLHG